ncbi:MAG: hypothetical protein IH623_12900 [Verrucomicrobia bacterium]|nr:hypothetical protein [Verrucomicrobiota bacterium]
MNEFDWNFDAVPEPELVACCYWEYARESAFIREKLLAYRKKWWCPGGELNDEIRKLWDDVERIQSIGHAAAVFIRGCCYEPGQLWQSEDRDKPNYRHPHAPPLTGSFPAPWQSLSEAERKFRAHIRTDVEQFGIVPIKVSHWAWAKEIARECQQATDGRHEQRRSWERRYLGRDKKGNFFQKPNAPIPPEFTELRPGIRWGSKETLLVDIAWECFTNDEIATYFRKWLKRVRPRDVTKPDDKGHKPGDWRAHLTRLAVMRLLARFTPLAIVDPRRDKCPAIWNTKQFSRPKWRDVTKWHDARREAGKLFHSLFPFLPKDEKPMSWERRTPGK